MKKTVVSNRNYIDLWNSVNIREGRPLHNESVTLMQGRMDHVNVCVRETLFQHEHFYFYFMYILLLV